MKPVKCVFCNINTKLVPIKDMGGNIISWTWLCPKCRIGHEYCGKTKKVKPLTPSQKRKVKIAEKEYFRKHPKELRELKKAKKEEKEAIKKCTG